MTDLILELDNLRANLIDEERPLAAADIQAAITEIKRLRGAASSSTGIVDLLIDDAFSVLQHDADETQVPEQYEREALRKKFTARLRGVAQGSPDRDVLAETIHNARWPSDRQLAVTPFSDEDRIGREYCYRIADAIYNAPGLYLSPGDSQKAAQVVIARIAELETKLECALAGEATWKACAEGWQERADAGISDLAYEAKGPAQITMSDIRLVAGEGNLSARTVLDAANAVLRMRHRSQVPSTHLSPGAGK